MKIIKGEFKGRVIKVPGSIRPASFRLKKSIFDVMREEMEGKVVLDLFAGSGALGLEALSAGAKEVVFIDSRKDCINTITANLLTLKLSLRGKAFLKDGVKFIKDFYDRGMNKAFDIMFLDPPYHENLLTKTLQTADRYDILSPSGYIVALCFHKEALEPDYANFELIVSKDCGQSLVLIYRKK